MEAKNVLDTDFKAVVISMLKALSVNFNEEIVSIKKDPGTIKENQSEMKNTITKIKNTLWNQEQIR